MRKIFLTLFLVIFASLNANATTQVYYTNTGVPAYISHGTHPARSINNFGYNAGFLPPHNRIGYRYERNFARPINHRCAKPRTTHIYTHNHSIIMDRTYKRKQIMEMRKQSYRTSSYKQAPQPSRFDKNYQINSNKRISCGGVTYYGANQICK